MVRAVTAIIGMALFGMPANAAAPRIFLECTGHNLQTKFQTEHEIAIYKTSAEFDGKPFSVSESATEFTLTGPTPTNDTMVYINRLTGEFAITPVSLGGDPKKLEESGKGEGCQKASPKF